MYELETLSPPRKARVEIIPLIDVIFFLLATFVLFTLSLERIRILDPDLPRTPVDHGKQDDSTLSIQASAGGTYYLKRGDSTAEMVTSVELRDRIIAYRDAIGRPRVFVRSDSTAKLGDAVRVLDEVRRAGIKEVAVETVASKTGK